MPWKCFDRTLPKTRTPLFTINFRQSSCISN
jgi:hypothetical protein